MNWCGSKSKSEYRDGMLYVCSSMGQTRIRLEPRPLAEAMDSRGEWKEAWPEFCIVPQLSSTATPTAEEERSKFEALTAFAGTLPESIREAMRPFRSHQWMLLKMLERSSAGRDLAAGNPVLAYALANSHEFRSTTCAAAAQQALYHSRDRQRDICKWLGFQGTPAMAGLFRRIRPDTVSPSLLRRLRIVINDDPQNTMKLLAHRECVTGDMIELIAEPKVKRLLTPQLLDEIAKEEEPSSSSLSNELFHAVTLLECILGDRPPPKITSIAKAQKLIEEVDRDYLVYLRRRAEEERRRREALQIAERARQQMLAENASSKRALSPGKCAWPPPPIPGTDVIVPLTSFAMLCNESRQQKNCIESYWETIVGSGGRVYAYRLLAPERATFTVVRRSDATWALSEIKGVSNCCVSRGARRTVEKWLYSYSISAKL